MPISIHEHLLDNLRTNERIMPLYQIMAHCIGAMGNRVVPDGAWQSRWQTVLDQCVALLPRGGGFDVSPTLVEGVTKPEYLVFQGSYHLMNQHGVYVGWRDYRVIVTPSFVHGMTLRVAQARGDLGEYVADSFHAHLTAPYDLNKLLLGVVCNEHVNAGAAATG